MSEDLFITFSGQLSTLPILLVTFGTYSIWSIPVNALVSWMVPVPMILGGVGAILGMFFQPLGSILVYLCPPLLLYFQKIIVFFAALGGVFAVNNIPLTLISGYYLFLLSVIFYFSKANKS